MRREYIAWFDMPNSGKLHGQSVMPKQELIRCKDCKWWDGGKQECIEWYDSPYVPAYGYCFRAERKEE